MATLIELQSRLETIDRQISNGVKSWRIGDKGTDYRPLDELLTARAKIVSEIAAVDSTISKPVRQIRTYSTKGV